MNSSQIYHLVLLAFFLVAIFSCQDKFINDLDIDLPEEEQLLVINLELTEGDSTASTFVARTANLDEVDHTFFEEAVVDLYKEGELLKTLEYDPLSNEYTADFNPDELSEGEYSVEVGGVSEFQNLEASQTIHNSVNIIKGSYQEDGTIASEYGYAFTVDEARITFNDPAEDENYYQVKLFAVLENQVGEILQKRELYLSSLNPFVETSFFFDGLLLKDDSFNGTEFDLSIGFSDFSGGIFGSGDENEIFYLQAELSNLSRDNYLFIKSEAAFREAVDNPFAEPVIVHNNVENGIGIFRTRNISLFRIDL